MFDREQLVEVVEAVAAEREPWESAGSCIVESILRERFAALDIEVTAEVALALMAAALLFAEHTPEFDGDARDALGELALAGLALLPPPG